MFASCPHPRPSCPLLLLLAPPEILRSVYSRSESGGCKQMSNSQAFAFYSTTKIATKTSEAAAPTINFVLSQLTHAQTGTFRAPRGSKVNDIAFCNTFRALTQTHSGIGETEHLRGRIRRPRCSCHGRLYMDEEAQSYEAKSLWNELQNWQSRYPHPF